MPRAAALALSTHAYRGTSILPSRPLRRMVPGAAQRPPGGSGEANSTRLIGAAGRPIRVLIVDDDPAVAAVLEDMVIEAGGESVGIITSALAAIGAAAVISPDVVLMDVRLPGAMDGIEAAGIIRVRGSAAVVIITGAASDPDIRTRLKTLEDFEIVFKPVLQNELSGAILRAYAAR